MNGSYLGMEFNQDNIEKELKSLGANYETLNYENLINEEVLIKEGYYYIIFQYDGTSNLKKQIIEGVSESLIRESWKDGLEKFKNIRKKYLLY